MEFVKPGGLDLKDRLVSIQRVTKVTKGGRAFGFSAIVVVGDENGVVGQGLGKSKEVAEAISKAVEDAKKNLVRIPLYNSTIPHEQKGKHGGARVYIQPASQGTGVIAGGGSMIMIPPSVPLIVMAPTMNLNIIDLYAGVLVPGLMIASMYVIYCSIYYILLHIVI